MTPSVRPDCFSCSLRCLRLAGLDMPFIRIRSQYNPVPRLVAADLQPTQIPLTPQRASRRRSVNSAHLPHPLHNYPTLPRMEILRAFLKALLMRRV